MPLGRIHKADKKVTLDKITQLHSNDFRDGFSAILSEGD